MPQPSHPPVALIHPPEQNPCEKLFESPGTRGCDTVFLRVSGLAALVDLEESAYISAGGKSSSMTSALCPAILFRPSRTTIRSDQKHFDVFVFAGNPESPEIQDLWSSAALLFAFCQPMCTRL